MEFDDRQEHWKMVCVFSKDENTAYLTFVLLQVKPVFSKGWQGGQEQEFLPKENGGDWLWQIILASQVDYTHGTLELGMVY